MTRKWREIDTDREREGTRQRERKKEGGNERDTEKGQPNPMHYIQ